VTPLAALLAERIRRFGPITIAEYMRECLYHPVHGYYSRPEAQRFADYYTSVDVSPIFGRLLARQFAEMWQQLGRPQEFLLVEVAAGAGRLAGHILDFSEKHVPEFFSALKYIAVEVSTARRQQLAALLSHFVTTGKCKPTNEIPAGIPAGCVFSNELIDALPVHRVVQQGGALKELFVAHDGSSFTEIPQALSTCAITDYFAGQQVFLCEGQFAEAGLEACDWITEIGQRLERGFVLTIDYGHEATELYDDHHLSGTLLSYAGHHVSDDLYAAPGEQDLTAHVNFTALRQWGERQGLEPLGLVSQTAFLLALGKGNDFADLFEDSMGEAARTRARLQLKMLIYPEGMGERFQVMIQQKGVPAAKLTGMNPL
jgi:SAM-dependent MidA family methyltransferase